MRVIAVALAVLGLIAAVSAQSGVITVGQLPAAPINSIAWSGTPVFSSSVPIYTTWADLTRLPTTVTVTIDTPPGQPGLQFITSAAPTTPATSVTLTLSGTALLNANSPAGWFAFALISPPIDPSSTTPANNFAQIRIQVLSNPDWVNPNLIASVAAVKRPFKISFISEVAANGGFTNTPGSGGISLVAGVLSPPITFEFLVPTQTTINTVTVNLDGTTPTCGVTGPPSSAVINCPGNFYSFLAWNPDANTPPTGAPVPGSATWNNIPAGTKKLTFQVVANPPLNIFQPWAQQSVYQAQNGRYTDLAWFPSVNGSAANGQYVIPPLRVTLSGGDANQYNIVASNPFYTFAPVATINQVPVFLDNVGSPNMLTGQTKTFTYRLAHVLPGQSVTYNLIAPPDITVTPATISFNCPALTGGAGACPTTANVQVSVGPFLIQDAYNLVQINAIQPSGSVNVAFPRTIPSININVVDRFTDNELLVDGIPPSVALGQSFTFSLRTRIAPPTGTTLTIRLTSAEFSFDQTSYSLSSTNTGFMVTATALTSAFFKNINYPSAVGSQNPATPYTVGGEIGSIFGFITAILSGAGVRNYLPNGIIDGTNANFGIVLANNGAGGRSALENIPAGGIEIFRPAFQYKLATLLNGAGTYAITTWDQPSAQITVALKNPPATGGITLTPVINCAFVTASPANLQFSSGTNEASFTLTANRDGATSSTTFNPPPCAVTFAMSGDQALNYAQPPPFTITVPTAPYIFTVNVQGGLTNTNGNPRSFQIGVTPTFLPRAGNSVTIQPFWALGTFSPPTQSWSSTDTAFTKTFTVTESDFIDPSSFIVSGSAAKLTQISWAMTGADAGYFTIANVAGPFHTQRVVNLPANVTGITVGSTTMAKISLSDAPTAGTLVITPICNVPGALTFTPPSYTFSAGSPTTALFQILGNNIGTWYVEWELTGTNQYLYSSGAAGIQHTTVPVGARGGVSVTIDAPTVGFYAGFTYGPYSAHIDSYANSALTSGSLTITPTSDDWKFTPATLTFGANGVSTPFTMKFNPPASLTAAVDDTGSWDFSTIIEYNLGGTDSWMYAIPPKQPLTVRHRTVVLSDETGSGLSLSAPAGVPVLMWVTIPEGPVPAGGITVTLSSDNLLFADTGSSGAGAASLDVVFQGSIVRQQVLVSTNVASGWGSSVQAFEDSLNARFSIYTVVSGPDAPFYAEATNFINCFALVKKLFYFDTNSLAAQWQNVLNSDSPGVPQIPLGQKSQVISVGTTGVVTDTVTLTPVCGHVPSEAFSGAGYTGCPYIQFEPSELTFTPGMQATTFTMTPRGIAPNGVPVIITWAITGNDAAQWEISLGQANSPQNDIPNNLIVQPVPLLTFSPMPAVYIDGTTDDLIVTLTQPTTDFPPFQLLVSASASGVVIQPDIMQFAPGQVSNTFKIIHARPAAIVPTGHSYTLNWAIKYQGTFANINLLPRVIPVDVTEVRVIRYAIIPEFPAVLGLDWLTARINLTRPPFGHVELVPHLPNFAVGQINVGANPGDASLYYPAANQVGVKAPGGRVIFDPPAVTFPAGQAISTFRVRADRLSDNEALYLRVDWEPVFHAEDENCYYPFAYTWHIAAASSATLAWALVAALAALLLL